MPTAKQTPKPKRRSPSYGSGLRMARIVHELFGRPLGWSFESILSDLNVNERTLQRYVNKLTRSFADRNARPCSPSAQVGQFKAIEEERVFGSS